MNGFLLVLLAVSVAAVCAGPMTQLSAGNRPSASLPPLPPSGPMTQLSAGSRPSASLPPLPPLGPMTQLSAGSRPSASLLPLPPSGPVTQLSAGSGPSASSTQLLQQSSVALSRPRRWILSWLLGHGAVIEHVDSKRNANVNSTKDEAVHSDVSSSGTRHSAEVHGLPDSIAVDLSSDTRVNYQDGRSRVGALAHESDAEVFDWNLFQDDKNKNAGDVNPHFYQSNSVAGVRPGSSQASSAYGSRPARTATGLLTISRRQGASDYRVNAFNRFPISYEQSQEYANSRQIN